MKKRTLILIWFLLFVPFLFLDRANSRPLPTLPDIVVTKIVCVPPQSKLAFTVENKGGALSTGWKGVADIYFDGVKKGSVPLDRPYSGDITPAGGSAYYLTSFGIGANVQVKVIVDSSNLISESNERNNELTVELSPCAPGPFPDLVISDIKIPKEMILLPPKKTLRVNVSVSVKNIGSGTAGASTVMITFWVSSGSGVARAFERSTAPVKVLRPRETFNVDFSFDLPEGNYGVDVYADSQNDVLESNEANNLSSRVLRIRR